MGDDLTKAGLELGVGDSDHGWHVVVRKSCTTHGDHTVVLPRVFASRAEAVAACHALGDALKANMAWAQHIGHLN